MKERKSLWLEKMVRSKTTLMRIITGERDLDTGERWDIPGLRVGYLKQDMSFEDDSTVFDFIFAGLDADKQSEEYHYMVYMVSEPLDLKIDAKLSELSGAVAPLLFGTCTGRRA